MLCLSRESNLGPPALQASTLWKEPFERPYLVAIRDLTCAATNVLFAKSHLFAFKDTVRPNWICMTLVPLDSPLKRQQPLYVYNFLFLTLNIWLEFKVLSRFMQKWIQPPACSDHGLHRILSSYWLAHFHLMKKIRQSAALFWFGLQNDGIFYLRAAIQNPTDISPAFLEHNSAKKIAVWAHATAY
jgi:hypothetical protein